MERLRTTELESKAWFLRLILNFYDHFNWIFFDKVLDKKGFDYKWQMWMWGCWKNVSFSFVVNRRQES